MSASRQMDSVTMESIISFCRRFAGVAVVLGGLGAKECHPGLQKYEIFNSRYQIAREDDEDCVLAAIINAIGVLRDEHGFQKECKHLSNCDLHPKKLGQAGTEILKIKLKLYLQKPKALFKQVRELSLAEGIRLFSHLSCGIYLVSII